MTYSDQDCFLYPWPRGATQHMPWSGGQSKTRPSVFNSKGSLELILWRIKKLSQPCSAPIKKWTCCTVVRLADYHATWLPIIPFRKQLFNKQVSIFRQHIFRNVSSLTFSGMKKPLSISAMLFVSLGNLSSKLFLSSYLHCF